MPKRSEQCDTRSSGSSYGSTEMLEQRKSCSFF
uniref:Uncharacterized protein n=1 Tax=Anguilla anguilla TaxID=7936 RepID=A0A0E9U184_ANGAN